MLFHYFTNYFMWEQFRNIPNFNYVDIDVAHKLTKKNANLMFVEVRKIYYNVMSRAMDMNEADVRLVVLNQFQLGITQFMNWIELQIHMLRLGKSLG